MRQATIGLLAVTAMVMLIFQPPPIHAWATGWHTWTVAQAPYYVNPANTAGISSSAAVAAFQTASSAWGAQSSANFSFSYAGLTTGSAVQMNNKNEVFFRSEPNGAVAASTYMYWDGSGKLLDTDIVLWQSDYTFFTGASGCNPAVFGVYLEDVATHEFGHALGLNHSAVTTATMYPYFTSYCGIDWRFLDPDDITGVQTLYPTSTTSQPPAAPSQLAVTVNSANPTSSLVLSWTNNATNADGYRVDRSADGFTFAQIAQLGSTVQSYTDAGLAAGATYVYRVYAYNGAGTSAYSNLASGQTQAIVLTPTAPSSPTPIAGATGVSTNPTLGWGASANAQTYDVYLGTTSTPGLWASNLTGTSITASSLGSGTTYYWRVVAKNSAGTTSGGTWWFTTKAATKGKPARK